MTSAGVPPTEGLSPRMRGSRRLVRDWHVGYGSIPAHAGEPVEQVRHRLASRVYPRACGGASQSFILPVAGSGLSPRMRGSPDRASRHQIGKGSIPAHAGEPLASRWQAGRIRVYPRACGGATAIMRRRPDQTGLSPRMRGSQALRGATNVGLGSIPAHAGEPGAFRADRSAMRVYPRACGGALSQSELARRAKGLSPRMRGSRRYRSRSPAARGSIPAHAGEPRLATTPRRSRWVYPRACGGAMSVAAGALLRPGLSPRMRGSL